MMNNPICKIMLLLIVIINLYNISITNSKLAKLLSSIAIILFFCLFYCHNMERIGSSNLRSREE